MKKLDNVVIILIGIVLLIIIAIILLLLLLNNVSNNNVYNNYSTSNNIIIENTLIKENEEFNENNINYGLHENNGDTPIANPNVKEVTNYTKFYTVSNCIQKYIDSVAAKEKDTIYNILDEDYISLKNITLENVLNYVDNYEKYYTFTPLKMKMIEGINTEVYSVYGKILEKNESGIGEDVFFIVKMCYKKFTFQVYPLHDYTNINQINLQNSDKEVVENNYNKYSYYRIDKDEVLRKYIYNYKMNALYNTEQAYNMLNKEYREKRFGSLEEYNKYIQENKDIIKNSVLESYNLTEEENVKVYDCNDTNGMHYIFREKAVMQYEILLDEYTIMDEEELQYYNKLDEFDKSKYNMSKFIKMVNTKDYKAIYNVLNETFRNNNFKSVDDLKQYIQNNMYELNDIEIDEYDDETYEYYVFNCIITNMRNANESKSMTIIINQGEGTDFTMSFSFGE